MAEAQLQKYTRPKHNTPEAMQPLRLAAANQPGHTEMTTRSNQGVRSSAPQAARPKVQVRLAQKMEH